MPAVAFAGVLSSNRAAGLGLAAGGLSAAQRAAGELAGYQLNFLIFAAVFVAGTFCWLLIDADKPLVPEPLTSKEAG